MEKRARELLPQVLLTLLSLIQAIALELLWSRIVESPYLYAGGAAAVAGWLQVSALVFGIVLVWLLYTSNVIRFLWVPTTRDSFFPFGIGLLEFSTIELLGPDHAAAWLVLMAAVYSLVTWASNDMVARAAREAGDESPRLFALGSLRVPLLAVGVQLALAAGIASVGAFGFFAAFAFAVVNVFLLTQTWLLHVYTRDAIEVAEETADG